MLAPGRVLAPALLVIVGAERCGESPAPERAEDVRISLAVSGGLAGGEWQVTIDGARGVIVGDWCRGAVGCDWSDGETLATVDSGRLLALAARFRDEGFLRLPRSDYGTECCDQFDYTLAYEDEHDRRTIAGSDGTLPAAVSRLVDDVRQFVTAARSS